MTNTAESPVITFPVTSAFELPGMRVERSLGITFGLVVRSMGFSKAVTGGISSLRQGEVSQFTVVLEDARRHAIDRMIENAKLLGANAVTREDAVLSVHAGFRDAELSTAWPGNAADWRLQEHPAGLFSHCLRAERRSQAAAADASVVEGTQRA